MATRRGGRRGAGRGTALPPKPAKPAPWAFDRLVEQATYLERLKIGEGRRARAIMRASTERVRGIVAALMERVGQTARPWESMAHAEAIASIAAELRAAASRVKDHASDLILQAARVEADWQGIVLAKSLPVEFLFSRVPEAQLAALARDPIDGYTLADWTDGIVRGGLDSAKQALNRGLTRGAPTPEITREVRDALGVSTAAAEMITRTAVTHASSGARQEVAEANADIVVGVRWVSVLDSRTSRNCAALDGQVFAVDDGPRPPAHPNCRSTTQLLLRSPEELLSGQTRKITPAYLEEAGRRATRGERPALDENAEGEGTATTRRASTTYGSWLRDQPATTQDRVLGRTAGRLFRTGELEIDQFVGDDYQPLTLAEIAERWKIALD